MAANNKQSKKSEVLKAKRGMGRAMYGATKILKRMTVKQTNNVKRKRIGQAPKPRKILGKETR